MLNELLKLANTLPAVFVTSGWQDAPYAGIMTAMYFSADTFPS